MFWRTEEVTVTTFGSHNHHLTIDIKKGRRRVVTFSVIYASPNSIIRREWWQELEKIKNAYTGPWLLAGDFNETTSINERNGVEGSEIERRCREFSNWIENNSLIYLGCSDLEHTWFQGNWQETLKSYKLETRLANEAWRLQFEEGAVRNLPKAQFGHYSIVISTTSFTWILMALKPFRFYTSWLTLHMT